MSYYLWLLFHLILQSIHFFLSPKGSTVVSLFVIEYFVKVSVFFAIWFWIRFSHKRCIFSTDMLLFSGCLFFENVLTNFKKLTTTLKFFNTWIHLNINIDRYRKISRTVIIAFTEIWGEQLSCLACYEAKVCFGSLKHSD